MGISKVAVIAASEDAEDRKRKADQVRRYYRGHDKVKTTTRIL
jgi:hypothetical protein